MQPASALSIYLNQNDNATQDGWILTENKWDKQINSPSMRYEKKNAMYWKDENEEQCVKYLFLKCD